MSPSWSPDGRRIAFLSNRAEGWDLYVMAIDGAIDGADDQPAAGETIRLTSGATADNPAWSPDGAWIAVERNHRVEAVSADGGERAVLCEDAAQPSWSPDGRLAFVRDRDLYVREQDGIERLLLRDAEQPHWSANGRVIVFARAGIWTLDVESGEAVRRSQDASDCDPAIAADGDIVFVRNARLMIIHPDGSQSDLAHLPSPAGAPALHPTDLDRCAFHVHDGGNWDIALASLMRGGARRLTRATWTSWNARL